MRRVRTHTAGNEFPVTMAIYVLSALALIVVSMMAGAVRQPDQFQQTCADGVANLALMHFRCMGSMLWVIFARVLVAVVLFLPIWRLVGVMTGKKSRELWECLLSPDHNNSPTILAAFILIASLLLAGGVPYSNLINYLIAVGFRGGIAALFALGATLLLVRFGFKIRSYDEYVRSVLQPGTDALAWATATCYLAAGLLFGGILS